MLASSLPLVALLATRCPLDFSVPSWLLGALLTSHRSSATQRPPNNLTFYRLFRILGVSPYILEHFGHSAPVWQPDDFLTDQRSLGLMVSFWLLDQSGNQAFVGQ